ncbi:diglucosylglycerate octanoyltransferase [Nocardia sp. NPDC057663]|uniref:diglucosylglycerate octanoyltransferase n=1 Tax=Nocardia sp. NPDC057663 TaxID=3346201 RepID=UPI003672B063
MSSEEPVRSVPDELFQQVTAKPGRQLPDALFGPPPARPARPEREEPIRSVPDELFKQVTARSERSLPDALFGPPPAPVAAEPEQIDSAAVDSASAGGSSDEQDGDVDGEPATAGDAVSEVEAVADSAAQLDGADAEPAVAQSDIAESAATVADLSDGASPAAGADDLVVTTNSAAEPAGAQDLQSAGAADGSGDPSDDADTAAGAEPTGDSVATVSDESVAVSADSVTDAASVAEAPAAGSLVAETAVAQGESLAEAAVEVVLVEESTEPRPVESASPRPVLLVIADSLAYYGPKGGLPADDPRIWPNMVAAELDWDVELIARIGWTCRDAYWALIGDPRVWAAVPRAGAVVFAVGGMDTLPSPLPTALRELIRYIRPPKLRRGVRSSYNWLQPKLSKLGRPVALPPKVSVDYLEQSREALNHLRPELPVVAVLPSVHKCDAYGRVHRGRARAVKALQAWSGRTSVPLVDLGEAVRDDIESGAANPDGIHWGWAGHAAVATAMTKALQEVR